MRFLPFFLSEACNARERDQRGQANHRYRATLYADRTKRRCQPTASTAARRFLELKPLLGFAGGLWIAWPKKARGVSLTLVENEVREIGLAAGLVDNKVGATDERWSGLRFVYRVSDRPGKTVAG